jgi:hypothetical protein
LHEGFALTSGLVICQTVNQKASVINIPIIKLILFSVEIHQEIKANQLRYCNFV